MNVIRNFLLAATLLTAATGGAYAADLAPAPAQPEPIAAPESSWDGFYVGAFAGYSAGTITATDPLLGPPTNSVDYSGFQIGVASGYNFHIAGTIVGGFGADIAYNNASGVDPKSYGTDLNWTGSLTGKLGIDLNSIVPYLVGGVAFANNTLTDDHPTSDTQTHVGYTVGAGVEFALADNLSANVEYRYSDYGNRTYSLTNPTYDTDLHDNSIRVGLNYHFH